MMSNAIKLTRYSQAKRKKALDKNEKMCGKALKTRLIFRGRTNEEYGRSVEGNQRIYDNAAKVGFPPDFFRETYFDRVTFYCLPDHTDFKFSHFPGCTFAVCRIREATFDGASFFFSEFQDCAIQYATFFAASIDHTHFHDSSLKNVSFQEAHLRTCNTVDCELDGVGFLNATLDDCFFGRVSARNIRNLNTVKITQSGATREEADRNRDSILTALLPWRAEQRGVPEKKRGGR